MEDKNKQVGSIITSTGMKFNYDKNKDNYFTNEPMPASGVVWVANDNNFPVPPTTLSPVSRRIQPGQSANPLFSHKNQDSGSFFSLMDPKILKKISDIMQQDTVYIRANTISENESPPAGDVPLKVQIHQYPHDWDNSVLIFMSKSYSVESIMKANSISELICVIITMSGRNIVFNEKDYHPNGE